MNLDVCLLLLSFRLTLELSCAMKFEAYPHDTQTCSLKMESLSYTTDDLIFDWESQVPLVVEPTIELPQHILVDTKLGDCMQEYSTVLKISYNNFPGQQCCGVKSKSLSGHCERNLATVQGSEMMKGTTGSDKTMKKLCI
ncbi:glycine receptor subunit alpha-2 [Trichonephila inaurata madagascariensis]|uniref:Glycine receptor subunit alpha-2 n=1 Tax=Trichonephila inaurata madagascariensis TaxID=2747483 RepID=A0A8X6Y269_9ARAC|nr:glycine receptor subunit alpha-2 [Trichonephila inaurata madagascariensis]